MLQAIYTLTLHNNGLRGAQHACTMRTSAWQELPRMTYDRARLVVKYEGQVYIARDLARTLDMWAIDEQRALVLTGTHRRLYEVTRQVLDDALAHCTYERGAGAQRQPANEVAVKERNFAALAWLEQLLAA